MDWKTTADGLRFDSRLDGYRAWKVHRNTYRETDVEGEWQGWGHKLLNQAVVQSQVNHEFVEQLMAVAESIRHDYDFPARPPPPVTMRTSQFQSKDHL